ncbi:MAG: winged helix-turn-helix domain-containing protein [Rhodococcus sp. (in: high G+C Gram-positive bacteria)]|uniref:winged helix-turn-helix domain-containing protein n=1 Tax=Rhodococcus sp. TaxID=1831 RepID=UPI002ADB3F73|nr:winged helix-turn-helix domain-containing protein [Rhodococcus sp. (in: high G+C Gram-positive bacteria)]
MNAIDADAHVIDTFTALGIAAHTDSASPDGSIDVILEPDTINLPLIVKYRSLVTDLVATQLIVDMKNKNTRATLFVVADRVTATARDVLLDYGAGYLDLRGRTALRTRSLILDTDIAPITGRTERSSALTGKAGIEVACAVLTQPDSTRTVRELARELGRSPSTISEILGAMRRENLIDAKNSLSGTELFWLAADHWTSSRTHLVQLPSPGDATEQRPLRLGLDSPDAQPGWALTDAAAAAMYGAPVAFRADQRLDFFVPDQTVVRRAVTLLGAAETTATAHASVRVAPAPAATQKRIELDTNTLEWPLAHPVYVALDLAQDAGRGREILDTWTPDGWTRVW